MGLIPINGTSAGTGDSPKRQKDASILTSELDNILSKLQDQATKLRRIGDEIYVSEPENKVAEDTPEPSGFVHVTRGYIAHINQVITLNNELIDRIGNFI